jgi:hypothetical protein
MAAPGIAAAETTAASPWGWVYAGAEALSYLLTGKSLEENLAEAFDADSDSETQSFDVFLHDDEAVDAYDDELDKNRLFMSGEEFAQLVNQRLEELQHLSPTYADQRRDFVVESKLKDVSDNEGTRNALADEYITYRQQQ